MRCRLTISVQTVSDGSSRRNRAFLSIIGTEGIMIGLWFGDHGSVRMDNRFEYRIVTQNVLSAGPAVLW